MEILPVAKCKWSTSTQCWKWLAPSIASRAVAKIWKWFYDRASLAHMFSLSFTHTFFPLTPSPRAGLPSSKANYRAPSRRAFVSPDFTGITCRTSITWRLNEPTTTLERERGREILWELYERESVRRQCGGVLLPLRTITHGLPGEKRSALKERGLDCLHIQVSVLAIC